jgi:hypothetical protein
MASYWNEANQTRVPFLQKFNDAVRGSEQVVSLLGSLCALWAGAGLLWAVMGQGWI